MKPGRSKPPGRFLPIASFSLATLLMAAMAGLELGLIRSPLGDDRPPKAGAPEKPKPVVKAKELRRPRPNPSAHLRSESTQVVVHDEVTGGPATEPVSPESPARLSLREKAGPAGSKLAGEVDRGGKVNKGWKERLGLLHRRMHNRGIDAGSVARKAMDEITEITDPRAAPAPARLRGSPGPPPDGGQAAREPGFDPEFPDARRPRGLQPGPEGHAGLG